MSARDLFDGIERKRKRVRTLQAAVESAYAAAGVHANRYGVVTHGSMVDRYSALDGALDRGLVRELSRCEQDLEKLCKLARLVLYGRSGHGGLYAVSDIGADILLLHYLQGKSWASIAREFDPETTNLTVWCKNRAAKACRDIDRLGMDELINS